MSAAARHPTETTTGVTRTLAEFCARLRYEDLPPAIVEEAKRLILDTIACGLGGHAVEKGQMAVRFAQRTGGTPEATIVGTRQKVPAPLAAFANGDLMNALDWNALLPPSHVPPYVVPAVLALAEAGHKTGRDVIVACVLAMEVAGRIGTSMGGLRATPGGFPLRVWGIGPNQVGATAGASHILGLDVDRMHHALGLGAYFTPIPTHVKYNYTKEVGYAKFAPSGWMAQGGVTTALLAEMGYRGDTTFLESERGYFAMSGAPSFDPDRITRGLGEEWVFTNAGYKYWPTCGFYQSPLDAFTALIAEHDLRPEEMDEVVYHIEKFASIDKYVTTAPNDHVEAAASGPYILSIAAHRIPRGPGWQAETHLHDPRIRAFMKKVRHETNPRSEDLRRQDIEVEGRPYLSHRPARITVKARGRMFERSVDYANWLSMGAEAYRPTQEGLAEKFRICADGILDPAATEHAITKLHGLETTGDAAQLMALLTS